MDPTYATYDPMVLREMENGLMTDDRGDDIGVNVPMPPRMARVFNRRGFAGLGQLPTEEQLFQDTSVQPESGGFLDSIGNALSNIIRTVGQQAPGIITGQPTSPYPYGYPSTTYPYGTSTGMNLTPILLIGGGLLLVYMMSGKRR